MNPLGVLFTIVVSLLLLKLPRAKAPLPLIMGASYVTLAQQVMIGPFHFSVIRILIAVGVFRVMSKGERLSGGWNSLDSCLVLWGAWAIFSSVFHKQPSTILITRLGLVYEALGIYFLVRMLVTDTESIFGLCQLIVLALIPIALAMVVESFSGKNGFAVFGGVGEMLERRGGRWRAQGPFCVSITAGTVGACSLPMALVLWRRNRGISLAGMGATLAMVFASASSGPVMSAFSACVGLAGWKVRQYMRSIRWGIVLSLVALSFIMNRPVYYLITSFDVTGHSTGWHRAALIEAAISHLNEWWLGGTDRTRHWMPTGVSGNDSVDTDITNQYLKMGVYGGLLLMFLFIRILKVAFSTIGKALRCSKRAPFETRFLLWTLGAILFAHTITFISVSYFDQSVVFLYVLLAMIGSLEIKKQTGPGPDLTPASRATLVNQGAVCSHEGTVYSHC
jgi:hypothetical protein